MILLVESVAEATSGLKYCTLTIVNAHLDAFCYRLGSAVGAAIVEELGRGKGEGRCLSRANHDKRSSRYKLI